MLYNATKKRVWKHCRQAVVVFITKTVKLYKNLDTPIGVC